MNKGCEPIIPRLAFDITIAAKLVHPAVAERSKKLHLIRREKLREAIPRDQRQTGETVRICELRIDGEPDDSMLAVGVDIHLRDLGNLPGPEDDEISH